MKLMIENNWLQSKADLDSVNIRFQNSTPQFKAMWAQFTAALQPGDELWEYSTPPETWDALMGHSGFAAVRAGKIVDSITQRMN